MPDIKRIKARLEGLKKERQRYEGKWRDIGDFIYPEATTFIEDYEKEIDSEDDAILNSVPVQAHRILASGMQAGLALAPLVPSRSAGPAADGVSRRQGLAQAHRRYDVYHLREE